MKVQTGTPVKTVVVALDVIDEVRAPESVLDDLQRALIVAVGFSAELQIVPQSRTQHTLMLVFEPQASMVPLLQSILQSLDKLERKLYIETRLLVHYGIVFPQQNQNNKMVYVGSALRAAQSHLRQAPDSVRRVATQAFAKVASEWNDSSLKLQASSERLLPFALNQIHASQDSARAAVHLSSRQVNEIGVRLAKYIGPLAIALVSDFARQSTSALNLVRTLGNEIGDPRERRRFEEDMQPFLEGWYQRG